MPRTARRRLNLHSLRMAAAVIWTLIILGLCWTPGFVMHKVEHGSFFRLPNLDKVAHGGIFVIFTILWLRVAPSKRTTWKLIVAGFALAIVSELGQLMPFVSRDANLFDMITDCAGVLIGIAAAPLVEPLITRLERRLASAPEEPPVAAETAAVEH
jgi:drug/metabolite transporter superfamily protein YnfA